VARELNCRDAGLDCDEAIRGQNDEVMQKAAAHASTSHLDLELTPDVQQKPRGLIYTRRRSRSDLEQVRFAFRPRGLANRKRARPR